MGSILHGHVSMMNIVDQDRLIRMSVDEAPVNKLPGVSA